MLCTLPLINIMFNTHDMGIYVCSNLNENQIKRVSYIRESQIKQNILHSFHFAMFVYRN